MKVSEIMTKNPVCCWPSSSTLSAAPLMQEADTGIVPVIQDPFTPRLVGVVTDRDLCLHVIAIGRDPASIWISGCMTEDPVCCSEQDDVSHALELMNTHQVRRLPVVNEKHEIVGLLSQALDRLADDLLQKIKEPNVKFCAIPQQKLPSGGQPVGIKSGQLYYLIKGIKTPSDTQSEEQLKRPLLTHILGEGRVHVLKHADAEYYCADVQDWTTALGYSPKLTPT